MTNNFDIRRTLGQTVRTIRQRANLSQEELANRAGLDRTYIGGIERGERNPTVMSLKTIADALEISLHELFKGQTTSDDDS